MNDKPVVLVTRKLPSAVEQKLGESFATLLNPDDRLYNSAELLELAAGADAILPCHTEKFSAETIAQLPERVRAIANFSVGVDHVDLEAARRAPVRLANSCRRRRWGGLEVSRPPRRLRDHFRPDSTSPRQPHRSRPVPRGSIVLVVATRVPHTGVPGPAGCLERRG